MCASGKAMTRSSMAQARPLAVSKTDDARDRPTENQHHSSILQAIFALPSRADERDCVQRTNGGAGRETNEQGDRRRCDMFAVQNLGTNKARGIGWTASKWILGIPLQLTTLQGAC